MQQDGQRPGPTPQRKAVIKAMLYIVIFPGFGLIFLGLSLRPRFSQSALTVFGFSGSTIMLAGGVMVVAGSAILMLLQKISPIAIQIDAAEAINQRQRLEASIQNRQRRRMRWALFLGAGLAIGWPLIGLLRTLQPTTPMLQGLSDADLQRIAIVAGIVIALAGYGMVRLLRRGDSGAG